MATLGRGRAIALEEFQMSRNSLQVRGSRLRENDVLAPKLKCDALGAGLFNSVVACVELA